MLKARLYEHETQKREKDNLKESSLKTDIGWGIKFVHMFYNLIN